MAVSRVTRRLGVRTKVRTCFLNISPDSPAPSSAAGACSIGGKLSLQHEPAVNEPAVSTLPRYARHDTGHVARGGSHVTRGTIRAQTT